MGEVRSWKIEDGKMDSWLVG